MNIVTHIASYLCNSEAFQTFKGWRVGKLKNMDKLKNGKMKHNMSPGWDGISAEFFERLIKLALNGEVSQIRKNLLQTLFLSITVLADSARLCMLLMLAL